MQFLPFQIWEGIQISPSGETCYCFNRLWGEQGDLTEWWQYVCPLLSKISGSALRWVIHIETQWESPQKSAWADWKLLQIPSNQSPDCTGHRGMRATLHWQLEGWTVGLHSRWNKKCRFVCFLIALEYKAVNGPEFFLVPALILARLGAWTCIRVEWAESGWCV